MWDLMYPQGYKPRSYGAGGGSGGGTAGRRCLACHDRIGIPKLATGQRIHLLYCQKHFCRMFAATGQCCTAQNNGRSQYCDAR